MKKPNIIMLVLDTQQARRMSMYGYDKDTTPEMAEIAAEGTVFERAISTAPWTVPSHASMFTGQYGTIHQTNQSYAKIPDSIPTIAELLAQNGYKTIGLCNNPLVGLLDNGLDRGFEKFYNYSGSIPDIPEIGDISSLQRVQQSVNKTLQGILEPLNQSVASNPLILRTSMNPLLVPIWTNLGRFKGDTKRSIHDAAEYVKYEASSHPDQPFFMFINMMETHLPYYPPRPVLDKWAPYTLKDKEARSFLQHWNTQSYRWVAPMIEPFTEMQQTLLRDVYDAEIAYQDRRLNRLFKALEQTGTLDNTMLIVVSDHGESHGDHDFMGHAFVNYDEVVHVPLFIRYPETMPAGHRVDFHVSARRVFHTMLEAAGVEFESYGHSAQELSLTRSVEGKDKEPNDEVVVSEGFPPLNFITVMEMNNPEIIDQFRCRQMRRAIFNNTTKLMTVDDRPDEFFDIEKDPLELNNLLDNPLGYENAILHLEKEMEDYLIVAEAHRDGTAKGEEQDYSNNPEILERLRALGYIE